MKIFLYLLILLGSSIILSCNKQKTDKSIRDLLFGEMDPFYGIGKNFDYFTSDKRQSFFIENFDNNNKGWITSSYSYQNYMKIENGLYTLSKGISSSSQNTNTISKIIGSEIDTTRSFEIEIKMNPTVTDETNGKYYEFSFSKPDGTNKTYIYGRKDKIKFNGVETEVLHGKFGNSFDVITIRKLYSNFYIFLNSEFIYSCKSWEISLVNFNFYTSTFVEIDYIKIDYLNN